MCIRDSIRAERAKVLYNLDAKNLLRKSYENPDIQELYKNYLGEPGSEKAHHLLHTTYVKRTVNRVYGCLLYTSYWSAAARAVRPAAASK